MNTDEGHYTTYIINDQHTYHINDLNANTANIRVNKNYLTCDNITNDGRAYVVFYQKIDNPTAETIEENTPTIAQTLANPLQRNRNAVTTEEQDIPTPDISIPTQTTEIEIHTQQNIIENQHMHVHNDNTQIEMYTTLKDPIPMRFPNEDDITRIREINNFVNNKIRDANTPEEFIQKIIEAKNESNAWNTMPNMHGLSIDSDINLITIAIIKGILPTLKEEKICGYPNCPFVLNSGTLRKTHWRKIHEIKSCTPYTPFEEFLEIQGKDIATFVSDEKEIRYIKCPLFKCPKEGCSFTGHKSANLIEHTRLAHKEDYNAVINLSSTYKILWILHTNKKPLTLMNLLYRGKVQQCSRCGWCTTNNMASANRHPRH